MPPLIKTENKTVLEEEWDVNNPPAGWVMVGDNEWFRHWECDLGDKIVRRTENKNVDAMLANNAKTLSETAGERWGDVREIGEVPMNIYWQSGLAEANKQKDVRFIKRFWNDPDNRKFRKFKGTI